MTGKKHSQVLKIFFISNQGMVIKVYVLITKTNTQNWAWRGLPGPQSKPTSHPNRLPSVYI